MTTNTASTTETTTKATQPQLRLILDSSTSASHWKLDEETRQIGRAGLAQARAALKASRPAHLDLAA